MRPRGRTAALVKGIGAVFVDRDTPGLSFGPGEQLMGFRGIPSADMIFEACRVPRDQLLAGPGEFGKLMQAYVSFRRRDRRRSACSAR